MRLYAASNQLYPKYWVAEDKSGDEALGAGIVVQASLLPVCLSGFCLFLLLLHRFWIFV